MTDFRAIVCGVDASDAARSVADTADWLAQSLGAHLLVLHVADEPQGEGEQLLGSIRDRLGAADSELRQVEGSPAERLLEALEAEGADLLVVGSRGGGSIASAVFGSVSRRLASEATRPVVVVPADLSAPGAGVPDPPSVVCGVDGSDHAIAAARLAGDLARRLGLRLIVVSALPDLSGYVSYPGARGATPSPSAQPDSAQRVAQGVVDLAIEASGGEAAGVVESGLPWDVLQAVADRENGRLLVVAARGLSAARAALLGSVTGRLAAAGRHPVVILPEAAERDWGSADVG